jgi:hypothetical protein
MPDGDEFLAREFRDELAGLKRWCDSVQLSLSVARAGYATCSLDGTASKLTAEISASLGSIGDIIG